MEHRAQTPVSLPRSNPLQSYWQDPPSHLASHRTTDELPLNAKYVVVGSGISGASIAYNLLTRLPNTNGSLHNGTEPAAAQSLSPTVLMLEARQTCSGATGRNGGHTKAASYHGFPTNAEKLGLDEATRIARLEMANVKATHAFAKQHGIQCDSNPCATVDVFFDEDQWKASLKGASMMNDVFKGDGTTEMYEFLNQEQTAQKYYSPGAFGGMTYLAGGISGYRFVTAVLDMCLERGLNLQTETPVTKLECSGNSWKVETDRGSIIAEHVVLATNGYTAHIEPSLQGIIVPLRGQVTAQRPGLKMPRPCLPTTYSFFYDNGYDYMIPMPADSASPGDIIIGGGWTQLPDKGLSEFGETNDGVLEPLVSKHLYNSTAKYFGDNWGDDDPKGRIKKEWTGIMGTSADGLPYVGQVPDRPNLWVSASFNGHGMVMCFKCAEAVVSMILGQDKEIDDWFPQSFRLTKERLKVQFEGRRNMKPPPDIFETKTQLPKESVQ